jgi:hypothetical protein
LTLDFSKNSVKSGRGEEGGEGVSNMSS